ncbi:molybdopterin-dependent oxidoreductase [Mycolicibacterium fluoranthenivorans]|uniref:Formate dehydrogenase n=1 Tax=Mycolicibacterium fluoranthenivorans TaxID=258505 RepID=A0A1G4W3Y9_9MYCO|nr:molybdopterin-dependent oxidoreductase [Mycolicibacterium fluoranthenivorans]SCX16358.1 formate dehydrogenase [Mycolicibacterium fluoranthenivorans]
MSPSPVTDEQKVTYCRICEPMCGLIATVSAGRLVSLRPDQDHPLSKGRACPKGIAFTDVQNDSDRVLHPMRRREDGTFERVAWDTAIDDIAARLSAVVAEHGGASVGQYFGNPAAFGYASSVWSGIFMARIGSRHLYSAGSQDINSRFVASKLLYGAASQLPFPDLPRTDFLLMLGANPLVSHGSAVRAPRIKDDLAAIVGRGGRVVVLDPRRTETARHYEHIAVRPDSDAWLLLSMLHVLFAEGLHADIDHQARGLETLRSLCAPFPPEQTAARTGVDAAVVRTLARDFAAAPSATAYGRTGACLGRHGTLVSFLLDALTAVTGNLDRPGGTLMSHSVIPLEEMGERVDSFSYGKTRSRIGGFPDVLGTFPAALMADEITTEGEGQLRALFVVAGNPVLSVPNSAALESALRRLDLFVSFDLYINETNRLADYVLPATTMLERDDLPIAFAACSPTLFVQSCEPVLEPYGEARPEWEVYSEIARRMGMALFATGPLLRFNRVLAWLDRRGIGRMTPRRLMGLLLRTGPHGDLFGLRRRGLNLTRLGEHPHGIVLAQHAPTGILADVVRHPDGKVHLDPPQIAAEIARLGRNHPADPRFPLLAIGIREMRSQNSWMHNSPTLMKGDRRHNTRIHPADAAAAGLVDGGRVRIVSAHGKIETGVLVTDEMVAGTVAIPQGWGHRGGGWHLANTVPGANVNELTSNRPEDLEALAGMAVLNGVAVRLESV